MIVWLRPDKTFLGYVFTACAQFETRCGPYVFKVASDIKMPAVKPTWNGGMLFTKMLRARVTYAIQQHDINAIRLRSSL
jgi:hypothetical protein